MFYCMFYFTCDRSLRRFRVMHQALWCPMMLDEGLPLYRVSRRQPGRLYYHLSEDCRQITSDVRF